MGFPSRLDSLPSAPTPQAHQPARKRIESFRLPAALPKIRGQQPFREVPFEPTPIRFGPLLVFVRLSWPLPFLDISNASTRNKADRRFASLGIPRIEPEQKNPIGLFSDNPKIIDGYCRLKFELTRSDIVHFNDLLNVAHCQYLSFA
jgi:hypothetical protein